MELADSLDSGSSVHYVRAGSSPASRTTKKCSKSLILGTFRHFLTILQIVKNAQFLKSELKPIWEEIAMLKDIRYLINGFVPVLEPEYE